MKSVGWVIKRKLHIKSIKLFRTKIADTSKNSTINMAIYWTVKNRDMTRYVTGYSSSAGFLITEMLLSHCTPWATRGTND